MDPILDKARAGQNFLERVAGAIPGFRGYREKELRRDADRVQREHLAARLEECKQALDDAANAVTRTGELGPLNTIEAARKRLDKLVNRIRYADRGYSGFFDAVKVDEAMLTRVYEFDLGLLEGVEAARAARDDAAALLGRLEALDARLAEREAILAGVK